MALLKCNRHWSNSWSTTKVSSCLGRARGKLGWSCWRSLSTKFNYQIRHKKRRTKHDLHIYVIILTYFHLYWKIIIVQDTYTNMVEKVTKIRYPIKRRREIRREAHLPCKSGPSTGVDTAQAHPTTDQRRTVARCTSQGGCGCTTTTTTTSWPESSSVVAWRHA
jgi:hypothetical protein